MSDDSPASGGTDRRQLLKSIGATTVAGGLGTVLGERALSRAVATTAGTDGVFEAVTTDAPKDTFPQSVASGGPTDSGVILWTRVAPDAVVADEPLGVQVAADAAFDDIVHEGVVTAERIDASHDYTVKVDLDGELAADRFYHYRFVYDGVASRTGRCRTLPAPDASPSDLSFVVLTCQDYQNGYYGAYHHVAEERADFAVHLGDFIYESAAGAYTSPTDEPVDGREISLPSGADLAESLTDFRHLYKTYQSDPLLQEGLESTTFIYGWDDHEVGNNRYWDDDANAPVLPDKEGGSDPETAIQITADGIQAWIEYTPARVEYDPTASDLQDQLQLWRDYQFGDLVSLSVTDERLFRDGPPCDDGQRVTCTDEEAAGRSMLGAEQKSYWKEWVSESEAIWTAWANEVCTMPLTLGDGFNQIEFLHDSWDGFQHERWELMEYLEEQDPRNFVTLTGDLHGTLVGYQQEGYGEIEFDWDYDRVGVEFMTPSVTSANASDVLDLPGDGDDRVVADVVRDQNDHLQFANLQRHGYSVIEFRRDEATFTTYEVDIEEDSRDAERRKLVQFSTPDGADELHEEFDRIE